MTADAKVANVEAQIAALERGATDVLNCPYCRAQTSFGEAFCCRLMAAAALAVLDRKEQSERADLLARISDRASRN